MTLVELLPNATTANTGALVGGATAHAVLSDGTDTSYVSYDPDLEHSWVTLEDLTLPAGAKLKSVTVRARALMTTGSAYLEMVQYESGSYVQSDALVITSMMQTTVSFMPRTADLTDAGVDGLSIDMTRSASD